MRSIGGAFLDDASDDGHGRAWYTKAVVRSGGKAKPKVLVAVMRKLALGLWHASEGVPVDSAKLFHTARLAPHLAAAK